MNELGEKLWISVHEGKPKRVTKFLDEIRNDRSFTAIINFRCDLYDEDGGNLITHCVKQGRDKGSSFGKDFWALIAILVENGADVNAVDKANRTPLFWACKLKYTNTVTKLLKLGADPSIRDQDDCNPFHISVQLGHKDITSLLLDHDEKLLGVHGSHGVPPLVSAVKYGQFETCSLLLERGADVNSLEQRTKRSSVYHAIRNRNLEILDLLLKYDPEVDGLDTENRSILYLVCECSDLRFFQRIHAHCPTFSTQIMDTPADEGKTPAIVACQNGNPEQLKHLLEEGASTSAVDVYRKTALHYCADNLETQCAEMLLAKDPSIMDAKDEQGYTALALSVLVGNINLIKLLLEKGADIETRDEEGHKLAHWAAVCGHLKVLDILIQHKADMESKDTHHAYPIHYAAQMNSQNSGISDPKISEKVLKKVLECKVRLTVVDDAGRQPLLWAACAGNAESCRLLLKAGADINSVDKDDLTALHCAASRGHHQCIEVLRKQGAELNKMDKNMCTPLFYAITLGNKECTKALIDAKADVNHVDGRGRNPAHCASIKGCLDTIKMLEKEKCDMWKQNNKGDYPVHEAAQTGHLDVVKYLLRQRNDQDAVNVINSAGKTLLHIGAATNNLPLCKLLMNYDACNKNALMKHGGKEFTPYDLAVIKHYEETAEYLKTKGALPHADVSNVDKDKDKANTDKSKDVKGDKKEKENKEVKRPRSAKAIDAEKKIAVVKTAKKPKKDKLKNGTTESPEPEEKENEKPATVESPKEEDTVDPVVAPVVVKKSPERKVSKARKPSNDEDKADPINTSQTSLQTQEPAVAKDSVTQNNTINEEERVPSPMGQSSSKKKPEPAGKFVTLEKYEETNAKPEAETQRKKPSKRGKVGFNTSISDNEDSGNETDHSRSRTKRSAIARKHHHGYNKKAYVDHVKDSVRTYNRKRETSRSLQQLRRAQIHSGPMHDIVMFSKMMDHYRQGIGPEEADMDVRQYANWDGYLNDQLRFVSHLYNDEAHTPRDLQETAKEQHKMLETEANAFKNDTDKRVELIKENEDRQVKRNKEMDREIDQLASRTAEMFDSVHNGASSSLNNAKTRNQKLRDEIRKAREEKLQETEDPLERTVLQRQEMEDRLMEQQEEFESARRMQHKGWHRRKDEEMRQRLLLAYRPCFPNDVFSNKSVCVSGGRVQSAGRSIRVDSAMTPRPRRTQPSPRPGSTKSGDSSNYSNAQSRVKAENIQVQMTPYGLRRVRNQERPTYANWSRKYDGSIRPRTGLVFVEPRVYGDLLREEKDAKQRVSNSVRHQYTNGEHNSVHSNETSDSPLP